MANHYCITSAKYFYKVLENNITPSLPFPFFPNEKPKVRRWASASCSTGNMWVFAICSAVDPLINRSVFSSNSRRHWHQIFYWKRFKNLSFWPMVWFTPALINLPLTFSETPIGNTEEESSATAIPTSIVPAPMLSVTLTAAWKLVAQARVTLAWY